MMTIGETRVRTDFNPSASSEVELIKRKTAGLIDMCEGLKSRDARLASIAQTAFEEACLWACKAATAAPPQNGMDAQLDALDKERVASEADRN